MSYNVKKHSIVVPQDKRAVIENFSGGVCIDETNSVISDMQSPDMLNMWYENNILCTRNGQEQIINSAYHERYFHNLFPVYIITHDTLPQLIPTAESVILTPSAGVLRMTVPLTNQGFSCDLKLERKRKYIFMAAVRSITRLRIHLKSDEKEEAAYYTDTLTFNANTYQVTGIEFTTGEYDIRSVTVTDSSGINNNTSHIRNFTVFDITDINNNFTGVPYLRTQTLLDSDVIKSYENDFSSQDIIDRDVIREAYRHINGSLSVVRNSGRIGWEINGFLQERFYDNYLFHIDGSLYSWDGKTGSNPNLIKSNFLSLSKSLMFSFLSRVYIIDGTNYFCVEEDATNAYGSTFYRLEEVKPYVPTVQINCNGEGIGDIYENFNLLTRSYKATYNTKSGDTSFYLVNSKHYMNGFTVELNKQVLTHGVHFDAFQTSKGYYIKLKTAVSDPGMNNLVMTCHINESELIDNRKKILNCTIAKSFGGTSIRGTRMFLSGNPQEPAKYYRSYIHNCTYFPDLEYEIVGTGTEKITAFESQYGALVVFTESSVYQILYSFDGDTPTFSTKLISPIIGCDMPNSVHLVDNKLVFANTSSGIHLIDYFNGTDEKNIKQISLNINGSKFIKKGLLSESYDDLKNAVATIFGGRYYLHTKKHTYVWDYGLRSFEFSNLYYDANSENVQRKLVWYIFDNIHAKHFITMRSENFLAYITDIDILTGANRVNIVKFNPHCNDFGNTIKAHFITKSFDFKIFMYKKILKWIAISSYSKFNLKKFLDSESDENNNGEPDNTMIFGDIKVTCICDSIQQKSYTAKINSVSNFKNFYNYYKIITSLKKGYHFAFKFESVNGPINISKVLITYSV